MRVGLLGRHEAAKEFAADCVAARYCDGDDVGLGRRGAWVDIDNHTVGVRRSTGGKHWNRGPTR